MQFYYILKEEFSSVWSVLRYSGENGGECWGISKKQAAFNRIKAVLRASTLGMGSVEGSPTAELELVVSC